MDLESLQMKRAIHGHDKAHPEIVASLKNLAFVYRGQGKLMEWIQFHEEGPVMQRIIRSPNTSHPFTATSVANLDRAYQECGQLQQAEVMHQ